MFGIVTVVVLCVDSTPYREKLHAQDGVKRPEQGFGFGPNQFYIRTKCS